MRAALFALAALVASSQLAAGAAKQRKAEHREYSCAEIKRLVDQFGQDTVEYFARQRGIPEHKIAEARRCL